MSNFLIGLLIGGIVAWWICSNYTHQMIAAECERLGGFFLDNKTFKCVAIVDREVKTGTPEAILEAERK